MITIEKKNAKVVLDYEEFDTLIKALRVLRGIDDAMDDNEANYLDVGPWATEQVAVQDAIDLIDHIVEVKYDEDVCGYPIEITEEV